MGPLYSIGPKLVPKKIKIKNKNTPCIKPVIYNWNHQHYKMKMSCFRIPTGSYVSSLPCLKRVTGGLIKSKHFCEGRYNWPLLFNMKLILQTEFQSKVHSSLWKKINSHSNISIKNNKQATLKTDQMPKDLYIILLGWGRGGRREEGSTFLFKSLWNKEQVEQLVFGPLQSSH